MKALSAVFLLVFSNSVLPQYEECGGNINCYHELKAEILEEQRQEEELEQEAFRRQQLELQQEQLNTLERQNDLLQAELAGPKAKEPPRKEAKQKP